MGAERISRYFTQFQQAQTLNSEPSQNRIYVITMGGARELQRQIFD